MAFPPQVPPVSGDDPRLNTTPMVDNHPSDHNVMADAMDDVVNEMGDNPKGTYADIEARLDAIDARWFPGAIMEFGDDQAPPGWVLCDGTAYDGTIATYQDLWAVIGNTWGGNDQSDFQVPDLRDVFSMGAGPQRAMATDGGRSQGYLVDHYHPYQRWTDAAFQMREGSGSIKSVHQGSAGTGNTSGASGVAYQDTTDLNLPPWVAVPKIIRL